MSTCSAAARRDGQEHLLLPLRPALDAPRFVRINSLVQDTWIVCERERHTERGREGGRLWERESHVSRLRALNVFAEFRVWKSQIRECHVHEIAQTSHDDSIAEIKCAIWWSIFWAIYQTLSRGRKGRRRKGMHRMCEVFLRNVTETG
jgi:hypothetical protein